jgi:hypothetical protein
MGNSARRAQEAFKVRPVDHAAALNRAAPIASRRTSALVAAAFWWDKLKPEPTIEAYRKFARLHIDAVNHGLVGIPEGRVRYHLCWGSWHGPHTHDLPLEHIMLRRLLPKRKARSILGDREILWGGRRGRGNFVAAI